MADADDYFNYKWDRGKSSWQYADADNLAKFERQFAPDPWWNMVHYRNNLQCDSSLQAAIEGACAIWGFGRLVDEMAAVLEFGAKKYAPFSWQQVPDGNSRSAAAACRHLSKIRAGEWLDPDSGLPHTGHAFTDMYFCWVLRKMEKDKQWT